MTGLAERRARKPPETRTAAQVFTVTATRRLGRRRTSSADYAALRVMHQADTARALALADSKIALAFAQRWAEIARMPAALRAAAAAALKSEQAAALLAEPRTRWPSPPS